MASRTDLLVIDPQWDFCNPGKSLTDPERGALYVGGAEDDMSRLAKMVTRFGSKISRIHVTLDSHYLIDVAHPGLWINSKGEHPAPFTIISSKDIKDCVWGPVPCYIGYRQYFISYTETLEAGGKYLLIIWPPHCLIGSRGHAVMPELFESLTGWQMQHYRNVDFVSKGSNPLTEHYGGFKAEVPRDDDASTGLNTKLIETLQKADEVMIAGEASSHCLKTTVEQLADGFGNDEYVKKIILLVDATSPVAAAPGTPDFPAIAQQFIKDMQRRGMKVAKTTDF